MEDKCFNLHIHFEIFFLVILGFVLASLGLAGSAYTTECYCYAETQYSALSKLRGGEHA